MASVTHKASLAMNVDGGFRPVILCQTCAEEITDLKDGLVTWLFDPYAPEEKASVRITHRAPCDLRIPGSLWMPLTWYLACLFINSGLGEIDEGEEGTTVTIRVQQPIRL